MAHSYIQAHDDRYGGLPRLCTALSRCRSCSYTYDTLDGVRKVIDLARELGAGAVRLDWATSAFSSSRRPRMLDEAGLPHCRSSRAAVSTKTRLPGRSPWAAADFFQSGFGVGTTLGVSRDVPARHGVQLVGGRSIAIETVHKALLRRKTCSVSSRAASPSATSSAGTKTVGRPLLQRVMAHGQLRQDRVGLDEARRTPRQIFGRLPPGVRGLDRQLLSRGSECCACPAPRRYQRAVMTR